MLKYSLYFLLFTHFSLTFGQSGKQRIPLKTKVVVGPKKKGDLQPAAGHFQSYKGIPYQLQGSASGFGHNYNSIGSGYSHSQPMHYQSQGGWCGSSGFGGGGYSSHGGGGFESHGYSQSPHGWVSQSHDDMGYSQGGQGQYGYSGGNGWSQSPVVSYGGHGGGGFESQGYVSHGYEPHYGHG